MTEKKKSILTGVLFLAFGAFMVFQSAGIAPKMKNDMGSGVFPLWLGILIIAIALLRLATGLRMKENGDAGKEKTRASDMPGGWQTIVLLSAYVLAFSSVGFLISTTVYLFLQMWILTPKEKRSVLKFAVIALAAALFVYLIFVYAINIPLPKGLFGF